MIESGFAKGRVVVASALLAWAGVGGCSKSAPPIARLEASPDALRVAWSQGREVEIAIEPSAQLPAGVERPILFVHLLDRPGSVIRTFDGPIDEAWRIGQRIVVRRSIAFSALAGALPPGSYLLSVGLYDPAFGRFAVETKLPKVGRDEYRAATVEVEAPPAGVEVSFSAEWLRAEPVADRQVIATRTLRGGAPGSLTFGPLASAGTILAVVVVPSAKEAAATLEPVARGAESGEVSSVETAPEGTPQVRIASSCGGEPSVLSGTGRSEVEFKVVAAGSSCTLTFEPNFLLRRSGANEPISIRLDALFFRPSGARP